MDQSYIQKKYASDLKLFLDTANTVYGPAPEGDHKVGSPVRHFFSCSCTGPALLNGVKAIPSENRENFLANLSLEVVIQAFLRLRAPDECVQYIAIIGNFSFLEPNESGCEQNLKNLASLGGQLQIELRPLFKTATQNLIPGFCAGYAKTFPNSGFKPTVSDFIGFLPIDWR